ncbi:hypothetical protein CFC21_032627 [Triticum aestivum]|uniref:Uncharacterized protein n=2 Tax=Triticum aestivum TaxID=4565 RepID=A0A3B6DMS1_WHEAT|nr:hypothetical protein CFC21_032627 [Triticum aestivum]
MASKALLPRECLPRRSPRGGLEPITVYVRVDEEGNYDPRYISAKVGRVFRDLQDLKQAVRTFYTSLYIARHLLKRPLAPPPSPTSSSWWNLQQMCRPSRLVHHWRRNRPVPTRFLMRSLQRCLPSRTRSRLQHWRRNCLPLPLGSSRIRTRLWPQHHQGTALPHLLDQAFGNENDRTGVSDITSGLILRDLSTHIRMQAGRLRA